MKINKEKLDKQIMIAKKTVASMYKCQGCNSEKNLQIHHLIMRNMKNYMDFFRYASQRYYWANQIVLCRKCHVKAHKDSTIYTEDISSLCIEDKEVKRIKKKYNN